MSKKKTKPVKTSSFRVLYVIDDSLQVNILPDFTEDDLNEFLDDVFKLGVNEKGVCIFPHHPDEEINVTIKEFMERRNDTRSED